MRSLLLVLASGLALAEKASAQTPDAGPDLATFFPAEVRLQGSLQGGTPVVWYTADGNNAMEDHVVRVSSATGVTSALLTDGKSHYGWPSDFALAGGTVWGADVAKDQLYTVDVDTGWVTPMGAPFPAPYGSIQGLAYDPVGDQLYGVDLVKRQLLRIDRATAALTLVGIQTLQACPLVRSLSWRPADGMLYAIEQTYDQLLRIDPTTGAVTVVLDLPSDPDARIDALAWVGDELYVNNSLVTIGACQLLKVDLADGSFDPVSDVAADAAGHALLVASVHEPVSWSQSAGPGLATFSDATVLQPRVSFSAPGLYRLELTVTTPVGPLTDQVLVFCDPGSGVAFCAGDGSGAACPCGNTGAAGEGCANSTGAGALLDNLGGISVGADDAHLDAVQLPVGATGIFFMGSHVLGAGAGVPFADGLLCTGGTTKRYPPFNAGFGGTGQLTGIAAQYPGLVQPGSTWAFQVWYRDVAGPCAQASNLSNALALTFAP